MMIGIGAAGAFVFSLYLLYDTQMMMGGNHKYALDPEEYKRRLRAQDREDPEGPQDPGNRAVNFRGEKRSNATHRSATDPDCRFASKGKIGRAHV